MRLVEAVEITATLTGAAVSVVMAAEQRLVRRLVRANAFAAEAALDCKNSWSRLLDHATAYGWAPAIPT